MLTRRNLLALVPAGIFAGLLPETISGDTVPVLLSPVKEDLGKIKDVWYHGPSPTTEQGILTVYDPQEYSIEVLYTRGIKVFKEATSESTYLDGARYWYSKPTVENVEKQLQDHSDYLMIFGSRWNLFSTGIYCEENQVATLN